VGRENVFGVGKITRRVRRKTKKKKEWAAESVEGVLNERGKNHLWAWKGRKKHKSQTGRADQKRKDGTNRQERFDRAPLRKTGFYKNGGENLDTD